MRYTTRIIVPPKVRRSGPGSAGGAHKPQVLGVRKSFGFDDPFGLATPGHLEAATLHPDFAPLLVQHGFGGVDASGLTPSQAVAGAVRAVGQARFRPPWGADANLLRDPQAVEIAAAAGFTDYTLDPSEFVRPNVDSLDTAAVTGAIQALIDEGTLSDDWCQPYVDRTIDLPGSERLTLTLEPLRRAAVKYGRAIRHCARLSEAVARANQGHPYETEVFFGAGPELTTALEHLFIGLELEARGVRLTGLGLKLVDAADEGRVAAAEARLRQHAAVAGFCGPYKLSFHGLSFLPALYPLVGRCCEDALHVKAGGLSYLEALRVVGRTNPRLLDLAAELLTESGGPAALLSVVGGNQEAGSADAAFWLWRSAAALFSTTNPGSRSVKEAVTATLEQHADTYREQLTAVFDKRLSLLKVG